MCDDKIFSYSLEPAGEILSDKEMVTYIKENCKLVVELTGKPEQEYVSVQIYHAK